MSETVINLKPKEQWRSGMTIDKLIAEMDAALQFPGVSNAWTMPIRNRIDMLATGIRTPIGVKIFGRDLVANGGARAPSRAGAEARARHFERLRGTRHRRLLPRYCSRPRGLARYGLMIGDVQEVIATALGGETVTTTVEGRERYGVNIRYPRDFRSDPRRSPAKCWFPCRAAGRFRSARWRESNSFADPTSIRTENGQLAVYIFVDIRDRDLGGYVAQARKAVTDEIEFPPGSYVTWSGQFEYMQRAEARMRIVVPVTLLVIFLLLYLNFRRLTETLIVMLRCPSRSSAACG